jgi:hypothetical protein
MVPSSVIAVAPDSERLMCGGFFPGEVVCLGNFEFIADYINGLILSPRRGDTGSAFMGSTRSEAPTPCRAMIEGSAEELLTVSSREGRFGLPSPRRRGTGASLAPVTTTPRMENAPAAQAMMTVPSWTVVL